MEKPLLSIIANIVADMKKKCNRFNKKSRKKSAKIKKNFDYPLRDWIKSKKHRNISFNLLNSLKISRFDVKNEAF